MTDSSESIRMELSVNGEVVATAGVSKFGVLTGIVSWVRRNPGAIPDKVKDDPEVDRDEWLTEELVVDLGGLDSGQEESVNWVKSKPLEVGDEVVIRILPPGPIDAGEHEPTSCGPESDTA